MHWVEKRRVKKGKGRSRMLQSGGQAIVCLSGALADYEAEGLYSG